MRFTTCGAVFIHGQYVMLCEAGQFQVFRQKLGKLQLLPERKIDHSVKRRARKPAIRDLATR